MNIYVFCIKIDLPNHNATMCPNVFQYSQYNLNSFWKTSAVEAHATHTHGTRGKNTHACTSDIYCEREEKIALEKNRKMVGNRKYSEVKFHTNNGRMRWQQQPHQFVKYKFMLKMVVVRYIYYENCKREREWATYIADSMTKQLTPRLMEYSVQRNFFFHF